MTQLTKDQVSWMARTKSIAAGGSAGREDGHSVGAAKVGENASQEAAAGAPEGKGEEPKGKHEEGGDSGLAVAVFKFLTTQAGDVTLKAQVGSAMPEAKAAGDFTWKGPVATIAAYDEKTLFANIADWIGLDGSDRIAYAAVEVSFYYSGKYINSFHAKLAKAELDKLASLDCELAVDDSNVGNSPDGVAHIDWTLTFRRRHPLSSVTSTVTGRASGDGTYTTSQPSLVDYAQEAMQQQLAHPSSKP